MSTISFEIPDDLLIALNESREDLSAEARMLIALEFFRKQRLSLGKAAQLAGCGRMEFMVQASRNGIPITDCDPTELERELATR